MKKKTNDDLMFLNNHDDQYHEILDNIEVNESTDSETTDILNFRVINRTPISITSSRSLTRCS